MIINIDIKKHFTNAIFIQTLDDLERKMSVTVDPDGSMHFQDDKGNWLDIVNISSAEKYIIGIVGCRANEIPTGGAFTRHEDYAADLSMMVKYVFDM